VYSVSITPVQASIKLSPLGRRARIIPYVGGGVGLYVWSVKLQGDVIDFADEWYDIDNDVSIYPIYAYDARDESKFAIGFHGFAGISVPVANRISLDAQFKYNVAKGSFSETGGFEGFEDFDLSAYQISIGLNYWF
jgi:opacity protein-like surface antigen